MSEKIKCLARVDVKTPGGKEGDTDSIVFYSSDMGVSMLVTCRYGGEAEVLLTKNDIRRLELALADAVKNAS